MRKPFLLLCILLVRIALPQPLVIQHVTVIDATGKPSQPDTTVVIAGEHIAAVGPSKTTKIAQDTQIVDGTGKFLIPGLWDMHVHGTTGGLPAWIYLLYLANGIVGVRDMNGPSDASAWRAQQASSDKLRPNIYLGSPLLDGAKPMFPSAIAIASEAQGREVVAQQQQRGADFIKVYSLLPRDIYFAIADESMKRGITFVGHVPLTVTAAEASDAGQKSIEHLTQVAASCALQDENYLSKRAALSKRLGRATRRLTSEPKSKIPE